MSRKNNVALLSVGSNTLLIGMKLVVGMLSGSVSILSEAIHSMMDWVAAVIAYMSVRISDKPADECHPFGHEKVENISGVIEGLLIVVAAGWIIFEAVEKLLHPSAMAADKALLGVAVMAISATVNWLVSRKLYRVAREEDSIALEADALHLKADVYTSLGVAVGLGLMWLTHWSWLDPLVAILVALFILKEAVELVRHAFAPLMDSALPEDEVQKVKRAIEQFAGEYLDYHDLRTRQSGKMRHIDLHLTLHRGMRLQEAHALCDRIETAIESSIQHAKVLIHPETCADDCICEG